MTRINTTMLTGPLKHTDLLDQHLFIAYREITRITAVARLPKPGETFPQKYTLGEGHMKFFYDKGLFLQRQCQELYDACVERGMWPNITHKAYRLHHEFERNDFDEVIHHYDRVIPELNNDWQPDTADHLQLLVRLHEKLIDKPNFYTLHGKPVSKSYYMDLLVKVAGK